MFDSFLFLLQIGSIIAVSRLIAILLGKMGQPQVVGEMAAGIALGPSLFGLIWPAGWQALFPASSLSYLAAVSEAGLVIFIFLIGLSVDFRELRKQSRAAILASNISVILPLLMGGALAFYLYPIYGRGSMLLFALFMGTAMSVTAFPVLARILQERRLLHTRLGSVALACAAADDVTAWILLAVIVAIARHGGRSQGVWRIPILLPAYVAVLLALGAGLRRWIRKLNAVSFPGHVTAAFIVIALLSAAACQWIGVHALVGAFAAGLIAPRELRAHLVGQLEAGALLIVPVFFALTGIRTSILFAAESSAWLHFALILFVAVSSKWGGVLAGGRLGGMTWGDASRLGILMNTRGLVELIVLNVGLESGILSAPLFSIMVLMALTTTVTTTPLLNAFGGSSVRARAA